MKSNVIHSTFIKAGETNNIKKNIMRYLAQLISIPFESFCVQLTSPVRKLNFCSCYKIEFLGSTYLPCEKN